MNYKKHIITITALLLVSFCQAQYDSYDYCLFPKVRTALKLLYPYASDVVIHNTDLKDSTQLIFLNCNCQDSVLSLSLLFNGSGEVLSKTLMLSSTKDIPNSIMSYLKNNPISGYRFHHVIETFNKNDTNYLVCLYEIINGQLGGFGYYLLKFKSSGELISKEKKRQNI